MYDYNKPDLFVHPLFFNTVVNTYDLFRYFNVCSLNDLTPSPVSETGDSLAYYINDRGVTPISLELEPYYTLMNVQSGSDARQTTYWFDEVTPIYALHHRNPRYVIWSKNNPMTICATRVDRVDEYGLFEAVRKAKEWSRCLYDAKSIIVFDLDSTLINPEGCKLEHADEILEHAKRLYDYVILWSHGSPLHVDDNVQKFQINDGAMCGDEIFDLILRNDSTNACAKNLLYLYNYFTDCRFTRATLMDDSPYNWTPEYSRLIVPDRSLTSLKHALKLL